MNYTREELFKHSGELLELIEDVVAYYCDENRISGELAYSIVEGIGVAKQLVQTTSVSVDTWDKSPFSPSSTIIDAAFKHSLSEKAS